MNEADVIEDDRKAVLTGLADRLAMAWRAADVIEDYPADERPRDRAEAYLLQDLMAHRIGASCVGWKVGATTAYGRETGGHSDIIPGRLFPSITHFGRLGRVSLGACPYPRVEPEFGFRINKTLLLRDAPWTAEEVAPYLTLHPAFEIIGNRFVPPDASGPVLSLMGVADNGGCVAALFGEPIEDWHDIDFRSHPVSLRVDGGAEAEDFSGEKRCDPVQVVADLATLLAGRGYHLSKGDHVLTGTATAPQSVATGGRVTADFGALGQIELSFE